MQDTPIKAGKERSKPEEVGSRDITPPPYFLPGEPSCTRLVTVRERNSHGVITFSPVPWYIRLYWWPHHSFVIPWMEVGDQDIKNSGAIRRRSYQIFSVRVAFEQLLNIKVVDIPPDTHTRFGV